MATYQEASDNLASGGLTGDALSSAQSSLANAYGVGTPTGQNFGASAPSQTQDASQINTQLSGNTQGTVFPTPAPAPTKSVSNNTSVPNPIATPQDIISQGNAQTPAEQTNQSLLQKVASLIGQKQSQQGMINTSETNAGVPALTKTVTDLNTQLEGLNNQAADLQNQARPGGAIENTEQQNVLGRGVTAAGLAPQTAGDLRKNQIQQSAIASQALTLKSAIYGAQGQLSLAKDAADKAAQAQYEDQQNQIDYQKALIDANLPQMNKEEKNQALLVQTQLADRQQQIDAAKQDKQTIIAMVAAAFKNNPNDPAAHYAAQQALALSNQQQPDIQKAFSLIGKYQSDPLAIQNEILSNQKLRAEVNQLQPASTSVDLTSLPASQQTALKSSGFTSYNSSTQNLSQQLVTGNLAPADLAKRATGASPYNSILTAADAYSLATTGKHFDIAKANIQYKFASNVQTQNTLNYLGSLIGSNDGSGKPVGGNLDQLIAQAKAVAKPGFLGIGQSSFPALNNVTQWARLEAGDPQVAAYHATLVETSDQIAKILQGGGSGGGTSDAKLAQAQALFNKGFTPAQITAVASSLKGLLISRAGSMTKDNPYLADYASQFGTSSTGKTGTLPNGTKVTRNADGTITDAQGNKYDSNGNKL